MTSRQTALITGANKGIGLATTAELAARGYRAYLGTRDRERGEAAARPLTDRGLDVRVLVVDVTDQPSVDAAAARLGDEEETLDVLVCNAGISPASPMAPSQVGVDVLERAFAVNVFGAVRTVGAFLPLLRRAAQARIVFMSSEIGSLHHLAQDDHPMGPLPLLLAYNASKTALNAVALHYAKELADTPIRVNAVSPGYVATDLNGHRGMLTPEQAADVPVHAATLAADGPTGDFIAAGHDGGYRTVPW